MTQPQPLYGAVDRIVHLRDDADGAIVMLNVRTRRWTGGQKSLGRLWEHLAKGLELQEAIQAAAGGWTLVDTFRRHTEERLPDLMQAGLLSRRPTRPSRFLRAFAVDQPEPCKRVAAGEQDVVRSLRYVAAAAAGFSLAMLVRFLPLGTSCRIMRASRRLRPQRPTVESTKQLVATVSWVSKHHPGWRDCDEISTGAYFAGVLLGKAPAWCKGASFQPSTFHVWLAVGGTAVDHVEQSGRFHEMLRI